jgi:hypothetical protein
VPHRPDLADDPALIVEGVVGRDHAGVGEPDDLAGIGIAVLRRVELLAFTRADEEELAVRREKQAMAVMAAPVEARLLPPDDLEIFDARAAALGDQPAAADGGVAGLAFPRLA